MKSWSVMINNHFSGALKWFFYFEKKLVFVFFCSKGECPRCKDQHIIKKYKAICSQNTNTSYLSLLFSTKGSRDLFIFSFWQTGNTQPVTTQLMWLWLERMINMTIRYFKFILWQPVFQIQSAEFINQEENMFLFFNQGQYGSSLLN